MSSISRRTFVRTGMSAVAALSVRGKAVAAPVPIRLGMASYTFRNFSRAQMIGFLKKLGVADLNAKNVKDHLPAEAEQETLAISDYSAAAIHLHSGGVISFTKDDDGDIREKFEYAKRAKLAVIVGGDIPISVLPRVEKFVQEYDIPVGIHNHGPEDKLWPSPMDVLKAVKNMDRRLGCCIDVGHCVRAGADVVEAIRASGPRLFNVHMKDLTNFSERDSQVAVGEGKMPVRAIFAALRETKYQGFVDLEYEIHADDPMPGVEKSFAFMRKVLADMDSAG